MPSITIPKKVMKQVKEKKGLYSSLNKTTENKFPVTRVAIEHAADRLKPLVTEIIEQSFRQYARAHHAPNEMIELEWKRFNKILQRNL